jgi:TetR/AcrR family transcriptional repressor of nem operon
VREALQAIDATCSEVSDKLEAYAALYAGVLQDQRMCLCGMLAADYETLPGAMRDAVVRFFDDNEAWLEGVLEQGRAEGAVRYEGPAREEAQMIVSAFEGAMLVARPYGRCVLVSVASRRYAAAWKRSGLPYKVRRRPDVWRKPTLGVEPFRRSAGRRPPTNL